MRFGQMNIGKKNSITCRQLTPADGAELYWRADLIRKAFYLITERLHTV